MFHENDTRSRQYEPVSTKSSAAPAALLLPRAELKAASQIVTGSSAGVVADDENRDEPVADKHVLRGCWGARRQKRGNDDDDSSRDEKRRRLQ